MLQETNVERYVRDNKSNLVQHLLLAKVKNSLTFVTCYKCSSGFLPTFISSCANKCNSLFPRSPCSVTLMKHWSIIWNLLAASSHNWGWTLHPYTGHWKHSHSSFQLGDIRCSIQEAIFTRPCSHYWEGGREKNDQGFETGDIFKDKREKRTKGNCSSQTSHI